MPGTAVTKSVVANDPSGRRREEIFVDIIEKISVTFSSSVSNYFLAQYGSLGRLLFTLPHHQRYALCPNICSCMLMLFSDFWTGLYTDF